MGSVAQPTACSEFARCRRRDRSRGRRGGGRGGGGGDWRDDLEEFIRKSPGEQNSGSGASSLSFGSRRQMKLESVRGC